MGKRKNNKNYGLFSLFIFSSCETNWVLWNFFVCFFSLSLSLSLKKRWHSNLKEREFYYAHTHTETKYHADTFHSDTTLILSLLCLQYNYVRKNNKQFFDLWLRRRRRNRKKNYKIHWEKKNMWTKRVTLLIFFFLNLDIDYRVATKY